MSRAEAVPAQPADVTVTPAANYQLAHGGTVVGPGESLTVPADVAERWIKHGLAERIE